VTTAKSRPTRFATLALVGIGIALAAFSARSEAHLANFTCTGTSQTPGTCNDDHYYCTLLANEGCWYDGDGSGCFPSGCWVNHSYTYQSAANDQVETHTVMSIICGSSGCPFDRGSNFIRLCLQTHYPHTDLHCTDQDDVTRQARVMQTGPGSGVMHGSPWW
jgi:hypothetical protein